ncbi:hypothetical protein GP486_003248 [Trichoglossum hirsutum]|uniref:Aminoglycoside phosphotransferase domain-containing protein n=1 Tax=Trichoglossum hirsutum TaxID=265104 RepID=A0A9P8RRC6_9PEZI|nr:hypothetical protein GP486_003248 [Trichoglossum hirsutum]
MKTWGPPQDAPSASVRREKKKKKKTKTKRDMGADDDDTAEAIADFFKRQKLTERDRLECDEAAKQLFPDEAVTPSATQGYCSYTLLAGSAKVIQFRPEKFQLNLDVADAATLVFGPLAPETRYRGRLRTSGLLIYVMDQVPGTSYKDIRITTPVIADDRHWARQLRLCEDFARFLALSWHRRSKIPASVTLCGKVGAQVDSKLRQLCEALPLRFRHRARLVQRHLPLLRSSLPLVLNHGDIVASNIMLDPLSGTLTGFVDWTEAELLPFGTCLYGLEELLGFMTPSGWVYYDRSDALRDAAFRKLLDEIPELKKSARLREALAVARDLGVLLWHGFAWDDGAIDRVVDDTMDAGEIMYLEAFFARPPAYGRIDQISAKL